MPRACYLLGVADVFHLDDGEGVGAEVRDVRAGSHHGRTVVNRHDAVLAQCFLLQLVGFLDLLLRRDCLGSFGGYGGR